MKDALWYLRYLVESIHSTVLATVDVDGLPVTAAIDMMDADEQGLYFLTARGKALYERMCACPHIALTGVRGEDTLSSVAVSVRGRVEELGQAPLGRLFELNPYMEQIYPNEASREALTVFRICEGAGEWFDLSVRPIERACFSWGGVQTSIHGYEVDAALCTGCGSCLAVCPQDCIFLEGGTARISQAHCLHCGRCAEVCPAGAISRH